MLHVLVILTWRVTKIGQRGETLVFSTKKIQFFLTFADDHNSHRTVAAEADSDANIQLVPSADIDRVEAMAYSTFVAAVDVDACGVDDGNWAVDARVGVAASPPANHDTLPFHHSLVCPIPPHVRGCVDATGRKGKKLKKTFTNRSAGQTYDMNVMVFGCVHMPASTIQMEIAKRVSTL